MTCKAMAIFNSLGSNYNLKYVLKSLFDNNFNKNRKLKNFLEEKYEGRAILTYKGREALTLAFKILNLPKESCVAINGFTCVAVFNSIRKAGLEPACIDLEETGGLNFTAKTLENELSKNKKIAVVVIQNTLGYPCDIEGILALCKKNNLILIEDLAHCVGTRYSNSKEAGTVRDFVVLSFSQDKIIDAVSGGALIIRNKKYQNSNLNFEFKKPRNLLKDRFYPFLTFEIRKYYDIFLGKPLHFILKKLNFLSKPMQEGLYDFYSLPDWYCNLALQEFSNLPQQLNHREKIAKIYARNLEKKILSENILGKISFSSNLRFPIFVENRNGLIKFLKKNKIFVSDIWYDDVAKDCPNAVEISKKILNLPTHINVTEKNALEISERINLWLRSQ